MTDIDAIDLDSYNPMDREVQQCPFDHYAALRERAPVYKHPATGMYFVSRLETVKQVLLDTATFSSRMSNTGTMGSPEVMEQVKEISKQGWPRVETMLTIDPPHQIRYRKLVSKAFTARRIADLEDTVREITVDLIEAFPQEGQIDFHADFAVALPVEVIRHALNMAPETADRIKPWSDDAVAALGVHLTDERRLEAAQGIVDCQRYWFSEYERRLAEPQADILSDLAHGDFEDPDTGEARKLDFPEVFSIVQQLMVAGNETTTKLLNETIKLLIENPHWWNEIVADPSRIPAVVEEGLRMASPNQGLFRTVTTDTELEGVSIPAGSRLWVMFGSANRDEGVFPEPDDFDPGRDNLRDHLAFGKGQHFCPGAPLSRLEARVALEELSSRLSSLSFSADNTFEYEPSFILRGLAELRLDIAKR
ncbi:MAG: cytochrome P450 [Actinomycetota bacterium]